jgi:hypothetical protein
LREEYRPQADNNFSIGRQVLLLICLHISMKLKWIAGAAQA